MTIRRIAVTFVGPDGEPHGKAEGSVHRRTELIRAARDELEHFKSEARKHGDPLGSAEFTLSIEDVPARVDEHSH